MELGREGLGHAVVWQEPLSQRAALPASDPPCSSPDPSTVPALAKPMEHRLDLFLPILASARVRRGLCRTPLTLPWLPLAFAGWSLSPNCAVSVVTRLRAIEGKATTLSKCLCASPTCPIMGFATVQLLCRVLTHCGVPHGSFGHFTCCLVPRGLLCVPHRASSVKHQQHGQPCQGPVLHMLSTGLISPGAGLWSLLSLCLPCACPRLPRSLALPHPMELMGTFPGPGELSPHQPPGSAWHSWLRAHCTSEHEPGLGPDSPVLPVLSLPISCTPARAQSLVLCHSLVLW